jgi:hypothetical protein
MNKPKKEAYILAQKMKNFKADLLKHKIDRSANEQSGEVYRVVSWSSFDALVDQLELCYTREAANVYDKEVGSGSRKGFPDRRP